MELAEKLISEYLTDKGIKQSHIAELIGMSEPTLSMTLKGKRKMTLEEYSLICGVLGVNTDCFLKPRLPNETKNC